MNCPIRIYFVVLIFAMAAWGTAAPAATGSWIEQNVGQADAAFDAIARTDQLTLLLRPDRARILLPSISPIGIEPDYDVSIDQTRSLVLELVLHGASGDADPRMGETIGGISRYFRGPDPDAWLGNVQHYDSVRFIGVYPGIDLVYRLNGTHLEYDFEVAANADVADIKLEIRGAKQVEIDTDGDWVARTAAGEFRQRAPEVFRVADDGLVPVAGQFQTVADNQIGFALAAPTGSASLIIDPVIEFSGYIGGSNQDQGRGIVLNQRDNLIVSGVTMSTDIPGSQPGVVLGGQDIFIAEIDSATGMLLWIDYIGGSESDWSDKIELDSGGNIIAAGYTESSDFPIVNAFQPTFVGDEEPGVSLNSFDWDAIVFKLADDGSALTFSTYYGGADLAFGPRGFEWFRGIAVDESDNIYLTGQTAAPDFPVTDTFLGRGCMEGDPTGSGFVSDIALVKFAPDGTRLFATCIGGSLRDAGRDVVLDDDGRVYIGGFGRSIDLPTSPNAFQPTPSVTGAYSAFVLKLNTDLSDIEWGTYVGGSGQELLQEIAVDSSGSAYGSGSTDSSDYPVTPNALQSQLNGGAPTPEFGFVTDAFVFKLLPDGSDLSYSSYFGGGNYDDSYSTIVDSAGRLYFAGATRSRNMPLKTPLQSDPGPLVSRVEFLTPVSGVIQGLAVSYVPFAPGDLSATAAAFTAKNGVNQLHTALLLPGNSWMTADIGTVSENSTAVIGRSNYSPIHFINSMAPNRTYEFDSNRVLVQTGQFGNSTSDSRAAVATERGGLFFVDDVIVANFDSQNELFIDATGAPTLFGRLDGRTVAVATGRFGGEGNTDVVFANDSQDVRLYRTLALGQIDEPVILSNQSGAVTSLAAGDFDGDGWDDLIIGNYGAPLQIVRFPGGDPGPVTDIPGTTAATRALLAADTDGDTDLDLFVANTGSDQLYVNDGNGNFTPAGDFPSTDTPTYALANYDDGAPYFIGAGDLDRYVPANSDVFVAVIDSNTGTLEFSTYLDGGGLESMFRGMALVEPGKLLLHGTTDGGTTWPVVGAAQATPGGQADGVFIVINLDVDADGLLDGSDNCLAVANSDQRNTDADAYGNLCDPDLNNDDIVNFLDLRIMKTLFFGNDPDADLDGDGFVDFSDLAIMSDFFLQMPGPSGLLLE